MDTDSAKANTTIAVITFEINKEDIKLKLKKGIENYEVTD